MPNHQRAFLKNIRTLIVERRRNVKKTALAIATICALIMFAAFCFADTMFAEPFKQNPWLPGALEAWCVAQCFRLVAEFFKNEVEENINLMHALD